MYSSIASLPLIGPDGNFEADLLLNNKKPIGVFVDKIPPSDIRYASSPILNRIRSDIKRLEKAASNGQLKSHAATTNHPDGFTWNWHFFSQPNHEKNMQVVAQQMISELSKTDNIDPLIKDYGEYFGYSNSDIRLFHNGGYDSLPSLLSLIFKQTHEFRVRCRVAEKLEISPFELGR